MEMFDKIEISMLEGESWWGGCVADAYKMPFTVDSDYSVDLATVATNMQISPVFISDKGRYICGEHGYKISFKNGKIIAESETPLTFYDESETLADVHSAVIKNCFEKDDDVLNDIVITRPQYCTWMMFFREQNQQGILEYAESIIKAGLPAGEFIIDGGWQEEYGVWEFNCKRFPDPHAMIKRLHELGFKVLMWCFPFMTSAGTNFMQAEKAGVLLKGHDGKTKVVRFWSGYLPPIDLCDPKGHKFFVDKLKKVMQDYGVDGFKFDGGHMYFYQDAAVYGGLKAEDETHAYPRIGKEFPYSEVRNTFGNGGLKMNFRIADRWHTWDDKHGVKSIVPCVIAMGLLGYPFAGTDMLGGGEINHFDKFNLSRELFDRYAQVCAFMPVVQFSYDFWNNFDEKTVGICKTYSLLRMTMEELFLKVKRECEKTLKPMVRSIAYQTGEFSENLSQYFFGDDLLVAPVTDDGAREIEVSLPSGEWLYYGKTYVGGKKVTVPAPLEVLPIFERKGAGIGVHDVIRKSLAENGVSLSL